MDKVLQRIKRWFNLQYRMTFRAVLSGLLASGMTDDGVIQRAHELTVLSLKQFQESEV